MSLPLSGSPLESLSLFGRRSIATWAAVVAAAGAAPAAAELSFPESEDGEGGGATTGTSARVSRPLATTMANYY